MQSTRKTTKTVSNFNLHRHIKYKTYTWTAIVVVTRHKYLKWDTHGTDTQIYLLSRRRLIYYLFFALKPLKVISMLRATVGEMMTVLNLKCTHTTAHSHMSWCYCFRLHRSTDECYCECSFCFTKWVNTAILRFFRCENERQRRTTSANKLFQAK